MCDSVHRGGCLPQCVLGCHIPPGPGTPPRTRCTPHQIHPKSRHPSPGSRHPPGTRYTPRTRYTPQDQVPPKQTPSPGPGTPPGSRAPWDQVHPPGQIPPQDAPQPRACWEIQSMRGWSASYCNAILFSIIFFASFHSAYYFCSILLFFLIQIQKFFSIALLVILTIKHITFSWRLKYGYQYIKDLKLIEFNVLFSSAFGVEVDVRMREKEALECGRIHIWALKTQKQLWQLSASETAPPPSPQPNPGCQPGRAVKYFLRANYK